MAQDHLLAPANAVRPVLVFSILSSSSSKHDDVCSQCTPMRGLQLCLNNLCGDVTLCSCMAALIMKQVKCCQKIKSVGAHVDKQAAYSYYRVLQVGCQLQNANAELYGQL